MFQNTRVTYEQFSRWLELNPECLGISRWMLGPNTTLSLNNKVDTPTFYQTLSGVTHLEEQEIVELEKRFWTLSANSNQVQIRHHLDSLKQGRAIIFVRGPHFGQQFSFAGLMLLPTTLKQVKGLFPLSFANL